MSSDLTKPAKRTSDGFAQRGWTSRHRAYSSSYVPRRDQDSLIAGGLEPSMCERTKRGLTKFFLQPRPESAQARMTSMTAMVEVQKVKADLSPKLHENANNY
jgi:hypothetical protein